MIRIIKHGDTSVNVVDDQQNFVGYSLENDCCANGDWFIDDKIHEDEPENVSALQQKLEFPDHVFDESFFKYVSKDDFNCVVFKLAKDWRSGNDVPVLYLHLYNCHNGYYVKGFKTSFGENREGSV